MKILIPPAACLVMTLPLLSQAGTGEPREQVLVTAPHMSAPLVVVADPKAPRQPLPAHDGADYLKTIPGVSVIRKGGTDGDPVLRGMAGSRLNILQDGALVLGGCSARMDPPTAYVYPGAFDKLTLIKGPQTVMWGPGSSAGTVLFERATPRFAQPGWESDSSAVLGSHDRHDVFVDVRAGAAQGYVRAGGTWSDSDDYEDGDGAQVHSRYERWNAGGALGWTPAANILVEFSAGLSDGEAAYADRSMDGAQFEREHYGIKLQWREISPLVEEIEAQVYYNYVDHVMDNYSVRDFVPSMMMPNRAAMNPDRATGGGRLAVTLAPAAQWQVVAGVDGQANQHRARNTMNQDRMPYEAMAYTDDGQFGNVGVFGEAIYRWTERDRLIAGVRADRWQGEDERATLSLGMGMMGGSIANPTAGTERDEVLLSGFGRYERDWANLPATFYAGVGHAERAPDFWELTYKESANGPSAFASVEPERNTQVDVGLLYRDPRWDVSIAAFYNDIRDYILIESNVRRMMPMRTATVSRNVDARVWGGEAGVAYRFADHWKIDGTLAYVRGENDSDDTPLAQQPPLEGRLGLTYDNRSFLLGGLLRLVDDQDRIDPDAGNIAGQDIGPTPGFAVLSLHGGWQARGALRLTAGIDNVLDKRYAEHLSRNSAMIPGYLVQTGRINEPGRTFWLQANFRML
jgi:iron complex outermembrane receptor protein